MFHFDLTIYQLEMKIYGLNKKIIKMSDKLVVTGHSDLVKSTFKNDANLNSYNLTLPLYIKFIKVCISLREINLHSFIHS